MLAANAVITGKSIGSDGCNWTFYATTTNQKQHTCEQKQKQAEFIREESAFSVCIDQIERDNLFFKNWKSRDTTIFYYINRFKKKKNVCKIILFEIRPFENDHNAMECWRRHIFLYYEIWAWNQYDQKIKVEKMGAAYFLVQKIRNIFFDFFFTQKQTIFVIYIENVFDF